MDKRLIVLMLFLLPGFMGTAAFGDLNSGLVAHWEFEGNFKDSAGTNDATPMGDAKVVTDPERGQVLELDGTGDYLEVPNSPSLNITGNQLTLAAWVWHDDVSGSPEIIIAKVFNNTTHSNPYFSYGLHILTNGQARVWLRLAGNVNAPGTTYLQSAKWHHLAGVYDGAQLRLYLDGKLVATNTSASGNITGYDTVLRLGINGGLTEPMDGKMDDVRIYNRALSEIEVLSLATGVSLNQAWNPTPADGSFGVESPLLTWNPGETARFHDVYFGTTPELTQENLVASRTFVTVYWHIPGIEPGVTYYWRVDEVEVDMVTVHTGDVWSFTAQLLAASGPKPADGAENVFTAPALRWLAGQAAVQHQVYFGSRFADVNEGAAAADGGTTTATTFSPGLLRASTTYYWRVDEIKTEGVQKGPVWSFTTEPAVAGGIAREWWLNLTGTNVGALKSDTDFPDNPDGREFLDVFEGPVNWQDNYGSRLRGWLTPGASSEYTFWIASDDSSELWLSTDADPANTTMIASVSGYTAARQWDKYPSQQSVSVALQAGHKYYIEALMKEGTGGDNIAVSWQGGSIAAQEIIGADYLDTFALAPLQAYSPSPAHRAVDTIQAPILSWSAGEKALQHEVYFGDDADAVANADTSSPLFQGRQGATTLDPGALEWGRTYYWRVDEISAGDPQSPWTGPVWSFTTADYMVVDDFESYTDDYEAGEAIFQTWIDGLDNKTGSTVGYWEAPFAEQTLVHGGRQSMPLHYNNADEPWYSEAERTFDAPQDWTVHGAGVLQLHAHGRMTSGSVSYDPATQTYTMTGAGSNIWGQSDEFHFAFKQLTGDGSITVRVDRIMANPPHGDPRLGVMIRDTLDPNAANAVLFVEPDPRTRFTQRIRVGQDTSDVAVAPVGTTPTWIRLTRQGYVFRAERSDNGTSWTPVVDTGSEASIFMTDPVFIGLVVCSHAAGQFIDATFSNVKTTGQVAPAGPFTISQDVGIPSNSPQLLYVALQDSGNRVAVVADPNLVTTNQWTTWEIPLADFTGVKPAAVKKMYIGVGDRDNPTLDGAGLVYIDDIRVIRPQTQ